MADDSLSPGTKVNKDCPDCDWQLVIRQNGETGHLFLGCSQYPECKHTEPLPEFFRMKALGHPTLFDLEE